jgi:hypothetical protein
MKIRDNLISDIKSFLLEALKLYNVEKTINRFKYLNLESKICALRKEDFESEDKYKYFLRYINKPELLTQRNMIENLFSKNPLRETSLNDDILHFFWIDSYLRTLLDWLK